MMLHEQTRAVLKAFQNDFNYEMEDGAPELRATLERFTGIGGELEKLRNDETSGMLDEMQKWITKLEDYGRIGLTAVDMLEKKHSGGNVAEAAIDKLEEQWLEVEENKAVITRMVMYNFMQSAIALLRGEEAPGDKELPSILGE
jgi:hypothetical protein